MVTKDLHIAKPSGQCTYFVSTSSDTKQNCFPKPYHLALKTEGLLGLSLLF